MANKDHSLDNRIIEAARHEFMEKGFEKSSLRKIASSADLTVGAIYTRYKTKDQLFCSLVQPLINNIEATFSRLKDEYSKSTTSADIKSFLNTIKIESDLIIHLLFDDYNTSVLLLCRSVGSSLENFFDILVQRKIDETIAFFKSTEIRHPDDKVLKLLISSQFHMYYQIINEGYSLEEAKEIMDSAVKYNTAGWLSLFEV